MIKETDPKKGKKEEEEKENKEEEKFFFNIDVTDEELEEIVRKLRGEAGEKE